MPDRPVLLLRRLQRQAHQSATSPAASFQIAPLWQSLLCSRAAPTRSSTTPPRAAGTAAITVCLPFRVWTAPGAQRRTAKPGLQRLLRFL
ncbi:hypothetical protein NDU88_001817 [Pleurodeles waltl]|uniref:Uncharacterized protein n=1 Tax=Pleurodeles waltl TaxID=8319 RepID=A0AAV7MVP3_PLEWA|nr:hypothetical protein NDU88_001817 [Pleurodeles waltl]